MRKLLLSLCLLLVTSLGANAQCVAVGGVNSVPQTGLSCNSEPSVATYFATGIGIVPAASATDVACLTGSATTITRLQYVKISGTAGTLVSVPITLRKNASADTGGTPATSTALPVPSKMDSTNVAAAATTIAYTANPTINDTTPLLLDNAMLPLGLTGTTLANSGITFDFMSRGYMQAPILRGIAQQICVNLNAVSVTSGVLAITFKWTEAAQ